MVGVRFNWLTNLHLYIYDKDTSCMHGPYERVSMTRLIAGLVCVVCVCLPAPAFAAVSSGDAAATRAYLYASEVYARGASAGVGGSVAAIAVQGSEIAAGCPSALTYAPRDRAFGELGEEIGATLFYAGVAPASAVRLTFARAVGGLSWSDRRLTKLVRRLAVEEVAIVGLGLPDVCADIGVWKASAYAALPQGAVGFLARNQAIEAGEFVGPTEESRERVIARLLSPYEGPSERRTMKELDEREQRTDRMLGAAEEAAQARLADALGVSAL